MRKIILFAAGAVALCLGIFYLFGNRASAGDSNVVACEYYFIEGTATIKSVTDAGKGEKNCPNHPVRVIFDFVPDDPSAKMNFLEKYPNKNVKYTIFDGMNPPAEWATSSGLTVGSTHKCARKQLSSGSCAPVVYAFHDVNIADPNLYSICNR
jgi:hypothetical protein